MKTVSYRRAVFDRGDIFDSGAVRNSDDSKTDDRVGTSTSTLRFRPLTGP
jgi:hypothetical protein